MDLWYPRLANVPHLGYLGDPTVDRTRLRGYKLKPEIHTYRGKRETGVNLIWGNLSCSPALDWNAKRRSGETASQRVRRELSEALELPGTIHDYYRRISGAVADLENYALEDPPVMLEIEALCLLGIRLIEIYPDALRDPFPYDTGRYLVPTVFYHLANLYEGEGYIHEAYGLLQRAQPFLRPELSLMADAESRDRVLTKLATLENENIC